MSHLFTNLRTFIVLTAVIAASTLLFGRTDLDVSLEHEPKSGNLAELLRFIAQRYQVSIIAELVYPVPGNLNLDAGKDSAISMLAKLLPEAPGYAYDVVGGDIVHVFEKESVGASANLLDIPIRHFTMPENLSEFKLLLPSAINSARKSLPSGGFVISGFPSSDLEKQKLQPREFTDISGRDLLFTAAEETTGFYSITILSGKKCKSEACYDYANKNWIWGSITGPVSNSPIYIQSPPPS